MQKDLEILAKEMQKLGQKERKSWGQSFSHLGKMTSIRNNSVSKMEDFQRVKRTMIWSLSGSLIGTDKDTFIEKGIDAFILASEKEKDEFGKTIHKEIPSKIATRTVCDKPIVAKAYIHE